MKKKKHKLKGQILIESIVAFAIVATTLVGVVGLAITTLRLSRSNARKTIAANLAKEAIEGIRLMRDNDNKITISYQGNKENVNFFNTLYDVSDPANYRFYRMRYIYDQPPGGWYMEYVGIENKNPELIPPTNDTYKINYDESIDVWRSTAYTPVPTPSNYGYYYRQIKIKNYGTEKTKKEIVVTVSYLDQGVEKNVSYTTVLTQWKNE